MDRLISDAQVFPDGEQGGVERGAVDQRRYEKREDDVRMQRDVRPGQGRVDQAGDGQQAPRPAGRPAARGLQHDDQSDCGETERQASAWPLVSIRPSSPRAVADHEGGARRAIRPSRPCVPWSAARHHTVRAAREPARSTVATPPSAMVRRRLTRWRSDRGGRAARIARPLAEQRRGDHVVGGWPGCRPPGRSTPPPPGAGPSRRGRAGAAPSGPRGRPAGR